MAARWEELASATLARQFPEAGTASGVAEQLARIGPVQSQTARSPFLALAARFPGTSRAEVTEAYESGAVVRGTTIRGTVHTTTPQAYAVLGAAARVGQRTSWERMLALEHGTVEGLWQATEDFASTWRSPDELRDHLHQWLLQHEGRDDVTGRQGGRYLAFGHGGLVRRPLNGDWAGQGAPEYRTLPGGTGASTGDVVELHLRSHGPASRHDLAWWSGMGLRVVDELVADLDARVGLVRVEDRTVAPTSTCPTRPRRGAGRRTAAAGVRRADVRLRAGGASALRRASTPQAAVERRQRPGAPPLLVDGRITGWWRATGSAMQRPLEVVWFAGTRRPRKAELDEPVAALEAALDITVTSTTITREAA